MEMLKQGAEAKIYTGDFFGRPAVIKERFSKAYRHPALDKTLTMQRTKSEVRTMARCRMNGLRTPSVYFVDLESHKIYMEYLKDHVTARDHINNIQSTHTQDQFERLKPLAENIGQTLGIMHQKNIIHGDLTTSNMLVNPQPAENGDGNFGLVLIDFGLGYSESVAEDKGVDLYVLERAFLSTHPNTEALFDVLLNAYKTAYGCDVDEVIRKLDEVRLRGRKRTMVG